MRQWVWLFLGILLGADTTFAAEGTSRRAASSTPPGDVLTVMPREIVISSPREERRVLISRRFPDGRVVDVTATARLKTTGDVVRIQESGFISPVKDGVAVIEAAADGLSTQFNVLVRGVSEPPPVGFVRDVMPVLSKAGCSSGTCHGSAKGKNGFKLSLRGYDSRFDYAALIDDLAGRRFNRADPAQSLMLLKPTMSIAHGGGLRFSPGSRYYNTLLQWIREGTQFTDENSGAVTRLEAFPREIFLRKPGLIQQVLVLARYPDGSERDVTADASFTSSSTSMSEVSATGLVKALIKGEAAIQVRYQGHSLSIPLTAITEREGFRWKNPIQHNYIDTLIDSKLKRLKIIPSETCTDAEFIRRVSLDLTGQAPGPKETRAFLMDSTPSRAKRRRLIEKLLASPEYADYWTLKWGDLLFCNRRFLGEKGLWSYRDWIRKSIVENKPYDRFVRELVSAQGSTFGNPPSNFFRATRDPKIAMETISQVFLGVRMMCANCHDHPFESWTQRNYYEMTAFFAPLEIKEGPQSDEEIVYENRQENEVRHPKYGYVVPARFPFAEPAKKTQDSSLRRQFAEWLTAKENPFFATAIANRVWSYFFGRGIFDPVDDMRPSNPASNPALLEALANDVKSSGFDLKQLMRSITNSRAYQSSYRTNEWNEDDGTNFSHQLPRRLTAEQLLDAVTRATGSAIQFEGMPEGSRAIQLPDSKVASGGFLDLFGRPPRESACECERRGDISLAQALNLVNGGVIADAIAAHDGRVAGLMLAGANDTRVVEELYLAALARMPDKEELLKSVQYLKEGSNRAERAQDLLWALLNSHAFLFNR